MERQPLPFWLKQALSFHREEDFPLYKSGMPYLFVLDRDMSIKMLFITDKASPDLTGEYLAVIKKRFPDIENRNGF